MGKKIDKIRDLIKKDKKLVLMLLLAIVGVVLLLCSEFLSKEKTEETARSVVDTCEYAETIEKKLVEIISAIEGAGSVSVMVTIETGEENVYAKQVKSDEQSDDEKTASQYEYEYIVVKSGTSSENGMLLKVIEPNIRGVAIVCDGGDNAAVRENIINTVSAVLNIKTNKISVCKKKS